MDSLSSFFFSCIAGAFIGEGVSGGSSRLANIGVGFCMSALGRPFCFVMTTACRVSVTVFSQPLRWTDILRIASIFFGFNRNLLLSISACHVGEPVYMEAVTHAELS